jgi:hypothetical protein
MEDLSAQRGIPGALLARVGSFAVFASTVATPVGYVLVGGVSGWAGVAPTMYAMGASCVIIVAFGVLLPSVRKFAPKPAGAALEHTPTDVDAEKLPT